MKFWNFWKSSNSVILEFDHIDDKNMDDFVQQIEEVEKYYAFDRLENLARRVFQRKKLGLASIFFKNPRKSVLLRAVPFLLEKKIPFTISLRADCIGLNRLPIEEELNLYLRKYPEKFSAETQAQLFDWGWSHPQKAEAFLLGLRKTVGPLPLEAVDPTFFFATWGKLLEIPNEWVSWGITLNVSPQLTSWVENEILFMRQQLGQHPQVARVHYPSENHRVFPFEWDEASLKKLALEACVGRLDGAVTHSSDWWNLPVWRFST